MSSECFLCTYNNHQDAVDMNQFVHENIGIMCTDVLAKEVHACLQARQGDCAPSYETIRKHITMHTLNPTVRMGIMLRGLLDLEDKMKGDLYKLDSNGQNLGQVHLGAHSGSQAQPFSVNPVAQLEDSLKLLSHLQK
jgi:hypothetical protein